MAVIINFYKDIRSNSILERYNKTVNNKLCERDYVIGSYF